MLHQATAEGTTMIQHLTVENFTRNSEVKKTRRSLIIVLSLQLVSVAIFSLIILVVFPASHYSLIYERATVSSRYIYITVFGMFSFWALVAIIFFIAYIMAVVKYNRTLILILAWITVVVLFLGFFIEIREIIKLFSAANKDENVGSNIVVSIISLAINVILVILTIIFSFKLIKLIKKPRANQIV